MNGLRREFWGRIERAWNRLTEARYNDGFRAGQQIGTLKSELSSVASTANKKLLASLESQLKDEKTRADELQRKVDGTVAAGRMVAADARDLEVRLEEEKTRADELAAELHETRNKLEAERRRAARLEGKEVPPELLAAIHNRRDGESVGIDADGTVAVRPAALPESLQNPQQLPVEDRSEPPPGWAAGRSKFPEGVTYSLGADGVEWCSAGDYASIEGARAAYWEHHDGIAKRAREQAWTEARLVVEAQTKKSQSLRRRAEKAEHERDEARALNDRRRTTIAILEKRSGVAEGQRDEARREASDIREQVGWANDHTFSWESTP